MDAENFGPHEEVTPKVFTASLEVPVDTKMIELELKDAVGAGSVGKKITLHLFRQQDRWVLVQNQSTDQFGGGEMVPPVSGFGLPDLPLESFFSPTKPEEQEEPKLLLTPEFVQKAQP